MEKKTAHDSSCVMLTHKVSSSNVLLFRRKKQKKFENKKIAKPKIIIQKPYTEAQLSVSLVFGKHTCAFPFLESTIMLLAKA